MNDTLETQKETTSQVQKNQTINSVALYDTFRLNNTSALDKLSSILTHNLRLDQIGDLKGNIPTIPINDLRGNEAAHYSREERSLRCRLASLYRLLDLYGWTQSIYNHISVRCSKDQFLINPFGLLYHEIQASSLVKIDSDGNIIDPGTTILGINKAGWTLHSALHKSRPEVDCVVHVHLPDVIAVSCLKAGLLPVCPEANELISHYGVKYHDYQGILVEEKEKLSIQSDLGKDGKVMFLRNHGVVVAARNESEAWYLLKRVITACQIQVRLLQQGGGSAYLVQVSQNLQKIPHNGLTNGDNEPGKKSSRRPFDAVQNGDSHLNGTENEANSIKSDDLADWSPVEKEFEAQMRILDNAGFCTGHQYRQPNLLRRGHYGPLSDGIGTMGKSGAWGDSTLPPGGTLDMIFDRTSAAGGDFSGAEDYIMSATSAGKVQLAKINESVKAHKQKSGRFDLKNGSPAGDCSQSNTINSLLWDMNHTLDDEITTPSLTNTRSTMPGVFNTKSYLTDPHVSASTPVRTASLFKPTQNNGSVKEAVDKTASLPHDTKPIGKGFSIRKLNRKSSSNEPDWAEVRSSKTMQVDHSNDSKSKKKSKQRNAENSIQQAKSNRSFLSVFSSNKKEV